MVACIHSIQSKLALVEHLSSARRRHFWPVVLVFLEPFEKNQEDTTPENCSGKRLTEHQGDSRRPLWLVTFRNWHLLYCGYGFAACLDRSRAQACRSGRTRSSRLESNKGRKRLAVKLKNDFKLKKKKPSSWSRQCWVKKKNQIQSEEKKKHVEVTPCFPRNAEWTNRCADVTGASQSRAHHFGGKWNIKRPVSTEY